MITSTTLLDETKPIHFYRASPELVIRMDLIGSVEKTEGDDVEFRDHTMISIGTRICEDASEAISEIDRFQNFIDRVNFGDDNGQPPA